MKQKDASTNQLGLLFEIQYPEIERGLQPRCRFMSAFEQKVQAPDKNFQYLVFAAAPYENIAFKIPNKEIDKTEDKFMTQWNTTTRVFKLQLFFKTDEQIEIEKKQREASHTAPSLKIEYRGRLSRVCWSDIQFLSSLTNSSFLHFLGFEFTQLRFLLFPQLLDTRIR